MKRVWRLLWCQVINTRHGYVFKIWSTPAASCCWGCPDWFQISVVCWMINLRKLQKLLFCLTINRYPFHVSMLLDFSFNIHFSLNLFQVKVSVEKGVRKKNLQIFNINGLCNYTVKTLVMSYLSRLSHLYCFFERLKVPVGMALTPVRMMIPQVLQQQVCWLS